MSQYPVCLFVSSSQNYESIKEVKLVFIFGEQADLQCYELPLVFLFVYVGTRFDVKQNKQLHAAVIFFETRCFPCSLIAYKHSATSTLRVRGQRT